LKTAPSASLDAFPLEWSFVFLSNHHLNNLSAQLKSFCHNWLNILTFASIPTIADNGIKSTGKEKIDGVGSMQERTPTSFTW
jgi:hypothetical protein